MDLQIYSTYGNLNGQLRFTNGFRDMFRQTHFIGNKIHGTHMKKQLMDFVVKSIQIDEL